MRYIKQYISEKLGRGISAIRLDQPFLRAVKETKTRLPREKLKELMAQRGSYRVLPKKTRRYKIVYKSGDWRSLRTRYQEQAPKRPLRDTLKFKSCHFSDRIKAKTITDKMRWMRYVRQARAYLRLHRKSLGADYQLFRKRIKGGLYRKDISGLRAAIDNR